LKIEISSSQHAYPVSEIETKEIKTLSTERSET